MGASSCTHEPPVKLPLRNVRPTCENDHVEDADEQGHGVFDVLIAGGGITGLSLALALRKSFGPTFRVLVADPDFGVRNPTHRTVALTAGSCHLLGAIGLWERLAPSAQPIRQMVVTDSRRNDAVRPEFLHFDQPLEAGEPFAHMIMNADLVGLLETTVENEGIEILRRSVKRVRVDERQAHVTFTDGETAKGRLLVGADGVRSRVRDSMGIATVGRDYGRSAIVATLAHENDHAGTAFQHFLPAGPFAMLPLSGRRSSIVWTERHEDARAQMALSDEDFIAAVERRFGHRLGRLSLDGAKAAFPLRLQMARRFSAQRVALVGDAARVVHPLAGQGLNLAFRDIAALVDVLAQDVRLGLAVGEMSQLVAYQRARFFDSLTMAIATDRLHGLFSNDLQPLRLLRDLGLGLVDRAPRLKAALIREAAGVGAGMPTLLTGRLP